MIKSEATVHLAQAFVSMVASVKHVRISAAELYLHGSSLANHPVANHPVILLAVTNNP
ncbi:MAG: hypothetical protein F6K31_30135 [Symploca sp. SIO2G7]|nr:hypothetical protein [Symploca sp. SIO2G7]